MIRLLEKKMILIVKSEQFIMFLKINMNKIMINKINKNKKIQLMLVWLDNVLNKKY